MKWKDILFGNLIGIINALFGSGGGMIAVPYLNTKTDSWQKAQAGSIAVILPLCILSSLLYGRIEAINLHLFLGFAVPGVIGAVIGAQLFKSIPVKLLKLIFSLFMLYSGIRMIVSK